MKTVSETRAGRHDHTTGECTGSTTRDARRTAVEWALVIIVAAALVAAYFATVRESAPPENLTSTRAVLVQPGDSLWSLARENPLPGLTTAQTVARIALLNDITPAALAAGTVIDLPAAPPEGITEVASR